MGEPVASGDAGTQARRGEIQVERLASLLRPLSSPLRLTLLEYLRNPHYLEEIASHMKMTRQATRKHVDQLFGIGVLDRRTGTRASRPVTEYMINPQALFMIQDEFEKLGSLRREGGPDILHRTVPAPGRRVEPRSIVGTTLSIVRGPNVGQRFELSRSAGRRWILGRDGQCEIAVAHDPYASNRHAQLRFEGGRFILSDLGSSNGTQYNWRLLPPGGEVELRHGDLLGLGKTMLLFWDQEPAK